MAHAMSPTARYALVACLGILVGALLVAFAGWVLPRVMSRAMTGMMQKMMGRAGEGGSRLPDI